MATIIAPESLQLREAHDIWQEKGVLGAQLAMSLWFYHPFAQTSSLCLPRSLLTFLNLVWKR